MMEKLRKRYGYCNVLVRILFVLLFAFARWQSVAGTATYLFGSADWFVVVFAALLLGVVMQALLSLAVSLFLNVAKFHRVPRAEYTLLALFFGALSYLLCGLLNLLLLAFPVFSVYGSVFFPFVSETVAAVVFFIVTSRLYFNVGTRHYYLKAFAIAAGIWILVFGGSFL